MTGSDASASWAVGMRPASRDADASSRSRISMARPDAWNLGLDEIRERTERSFSSDRRYEMAASGGTDVRGLRDVSASSSARAERRDTTATQARVAERDRYMAKRFPLTGRRFWFVLSLFSIGMRERLAGTYHRTHRSASGRHPHSRRPSHLRPVTGDIVMRWDDANPRLDRNIHAQSNIVGNTIPLHGPILINGTDSYDANPVNGENIAFSNTNGAPADAIPLAPASASSRATTSGSDRSSRSRQCVMPPARAGAFDQHVGRYRLRNSPAGTPASINNGKTAFGWGMEAFANAGHVWGAAGATTLHEGFKGGWACHCEFDLNNNAGNVGIGYGDIGGVCNVFMNASSAYQSLAAIWVTGNIGRTASQSGNGVYDVGCSSRRPGMHPIPRDIRGKTAHQPGDPVRGYDRAFRYRAQRRAPA